MRFAEGAPAIELAEAILGGTRARKLSDWPFRRGQQGAEKSANVSSRSCVVRLLLLLAAYEDADIFSGCWNLVAKGQGQAARSSPGRTFAQLSHPVPSNMADPRTKVRSNTSRNNHNLQADAASLLPRSVSAETSRMASYSRKQRG